MAPWLVSRTAVRAVSQPTSFRAYQIANVRQNYEHLINILLSLSNGLPTHSRFRANLVAARTRHVVVAFSRYNVDSEEWLQSSSLMTK
ncbi:hypothetical protein evm_014774 [Chilo suppressalis]|nr:hypothetical protein evm_014774 [Chilo suppressalis]